MPKTGRAMEERKTKKAGWPFNWPPAFFVFSHGFCECLLNLSSPLKKFHFSIDRFFRHKLAKLIFLV